MTPAVISVVVVVAFAGASFFFALAETSLLSLGKWQVRQLAARDPKRGAVVVWLLGEPQDLLATLVLGNTFATAAILSTGLWMGLQDRWPLGLSVLALFFLILIGCEVVPKTLAVRHPERWALRVARPMQVMERLALPLRRIAQGINTRLIRRFSPGSVKTQSPSTDSDYKELIDMAYHQGALAQSEREIILQIISLDRRTVRDVMKPRAQVKAIPDDISMEEMVAAAQKYRQRRLPMYDETPDTIAGVLNTRVLLLDPNIDLADAIEFPSFVPESMNLLQLLKSLQRQQGGMAIVMDEFGGTAGIVTMEDILEEMIGKIRGESEPEGFLMEKLGPGRWRVNGTLRIDDFRREYPALSRVPEVDTMGGLLMFLLDVVPAPGDSATCNGLKLTAQAGDERRVRELLVEEVR